MIQNFTHMYSRISVILAVTSIKMPGPAALGHAVSFLVGRSVGQRMPDHRGWSPDTPRSNYRVIHAGCCLWTLPSLDRPARSREDATVRLRRSCHERSL